MDTLFSFADKSQTLRHQLFKRHWLSQLTNKSPTLFEEDRQPGVSLIHNLNPTKVYNLTNGNQEQLTTIMNEVSNKYEDEGDDNDDDDDVIADDEEFRDPEDDLNLKTKTVVDTEATRDDSMDSTWDSSDRPAVKQKTGRHSNKRKISARKRRELTFQLEEKTVETLVVVDKEMFDYHESEALIQPYVLTILNIVGFLS